MKKTALVLLIATTIGGAAHAGCREARGTIAAEVTPPGFPCASEVGICTHGTLTGSGFLRGTTFYVAHSVAPIAIDPTGATLSYRGTLTITNKRGTITVDDVGLWDTVGGVISSQNQNGGIAGTGRYNGANGLFFTHGVQGIDADMLPGFASGISGKICVDGRDASDLDAD